MIKVVAMMLSKTKSVLTHRYIHNSIGVIALKSYDERIAELNAKKEQKEKELAELKAKERKLLQEKKALERKARTKRLIETGAIVESVLGRPVEEEDIEPIKQLIAYYRNKKLSGQPILKQQSSTNE